MVGCCFCDGGVVDVMIVGDGGIGGGGGGGDCGDHGGMIMVMMTISIGVKNVR